MADIDHVVTIGAKTTGLRTDWAKRDPEVVFDPWGVEPDLVPSPLSARAVARINTVARDLCNSV